MLVVARMMLAGIDEVPQREDAASVAAGVVVVALLVNYRDDA